MSFNRKINELDVNMAQRVPILGPALQLTIEDTAVTSGIDAKLRKSLLESMLVAAAAAAAKASPLGS